MEHRVHDGIYAIPNNRRYPVVSFPIASVVEEHQHAMQHQQQQYHHPDTTTMSTKRSMIRSSDGAANRSADTTGDYYSVLRDHFPSAVDDLGRHNRHSSTPLVDGAPFDRRPTWNKSVKIDSHAVHPYYDPRVARDEANADDQLRRSTNNAPVDDVNASVLSHCSKGDITTSRPRESTCHCLDKRCESCGFAVVDGEIVVESPRGRSMSPVAQQMQRTSRAADNDEETSGASSTTSSDTETYDDEAYDNTDHTAAAMNRKENPCSNPDFKPKPGALNVVPSRDEHPRGTSEASATQHAAAIVAAHTERHQLLKQAKLTRFAADVSGRLKEKRQQQRRLWSKYEASRTEKLTQQLRLEDLAAFQRDSEVAKREWEERARRQRAAQVAEEIRQAKVAIHGERGDENRYAADLDFYYCNRLPIPTLNPLVPW